MITLAEGGMAKLQQRVNQAERLKAGGEWHLFLENIAVCVLNQITEKCKK